MGMTRDDYERAARMIATSGHGVCHRAFLAHFMCAFFRDEEDFDSLEFCVAAGVLKKDELGSYIAV